MIIAQISDLHAHVEGDYAYGRVNTLPMIQRAITHLNQLDPRPDLVVATGDLTHHGELAEYEVLETLLAELAIPLYLLPGNHDRRRSLQQVLGNYIPTDISPTDISPTDSPLQYVVEKQSVRLIMLDTVVADVDGGCLDKARLDWLEKKMAITPTKPTFLFMHHPPFATGIPTMDCIGLAGSDQLAKLIARYPAIQRIAAGHLHRPIFCHWAGTVASTAPSLVHQVALEMRSDVPGEFVMEPPAYHLHIWRELEQEWVSHTAYVDQYPGPYKFSEYR